MRVIQDTNALIWATDDGGQLSAKARRHLNDPATVKIVSVIVFWEMAIKALHLRRLLTLPLLHRF